VSNGSKNILAPKWVLKYFRCPMDVQISYVSNECKKNLGLKFEQNILGIKWV